jgi:outer membrane protein TolC
MRLAYYTVESLKKLALVTIAILSLGSMPPTVEALSLEEVLARIDQTNDVKLAFIAVESAASETHLLKHPGDPNVSLTPGIKAISQEQGDFGEQVDLTGSVSFGVPIGLTDFQRERVFEAEVDLQVAQRNLQDAREGMLLRLYSLYQAAWLAQEETRILEQEATAARANYEITKERFEDGEVALIDLTAKDKDRQQAEDLYLQGLLNKRLSWLELAFTAKLDPEFGVLDPPSIDGSEIELPRPPDLASWAYLNHPTMVEQRLKIKTINNSIERLKKLDYTLNLRTFFNYQDHSASLGYVFTSPELTSSYSFPITSFGEIPQSTGAGSQIDTWNTGVTIGFTLATGTNDGLAIDSLKLDLRREMERLDLLKRTLDLEIRSKYQQWLKAQDSVAQAENGLAFALENRNIAETKKSIGLIGDGEMLEADAAVERARWNLDKAKIDLVRTRMAAADAAGYLGRVYPIENKMEAE